MTDLDHDELESALSDFAPKKKETGRPPEEARVIAGFEDIVRFVDEHKRKPQHGADRDIFERLYAVRLDRIRASKTHRALVADLDTHGLLAGATDEDTDTLDDETLDELLGEETTRDADDITVLKNVKPRAEIKAAEDVADRKPCKEFRKFKPLFASVEKDLDRGARETRPFKRDASIEAGEFFVLGGQIAYVAEAGEVEWRTKDERPDRRLRIVFDNATESDMLMRSLQRALYKDETGRRITDPNAGPLFGNSPDEGDAESGTIYILRSLSNHPEIARHRELIHKIGVTARDVEIRVSVAEDDPTFLFADVDVVATYKLFNINRSRLENLLHRVFAPARLSVEIPDRFGRLVKPREWFLVPLHVINEAVERVKDGSIVGCVYDARRAALVARGDRGA